MKKIIQNQKRKKTHVVKGDLVQVISGNHKKKKGNILQVNTKKNQVIVEGIRIIKKHIKKNQEHPNGSIIEFEGPIHISNVKKIDK